MKIKKLSLYKITSIIKAGEAEAFVFQEFKRLPDGLEMIRRFHSVMEKRLTYFDQRWVALYGEDTHELTEWANRMRSIRRHLDEMARHLSVAGTPLFNWDKLLASMGYVNASRVAIEQMLYFNRPPAA